MTLDTFVNDVTLFYAAVRIAPQDVTPRMVEGYIAGDEEAFDGFVDIAPPMGQWPAFFVTVADRVNTHGGRFVQTP